MRRSTERIITSHVGALPRPATLPGRGAKSYDVDPLLQARRRIKDLEKELKATRAAAALFEEGRADPKGSSRLSED